MLKEPKLLELNSYLAIPAILLILTVGSHAGIAMGGAAGSSHFSDSHDFAWSAFLYHKFDEQVLIGLKSGRQSGGIPVQAALYVRLPLGRVVMPAVIGDLGYFFHTNQAGPIWKAGGGMDWKNGERSSILLLGGLENIKGTSNIFSRIGLLLEF